MSSPEEEVPVVVIREPTAQVVVRSLPKPYIIVQQVGIAGPPGRDAGLKRWYGEGPPETIIGAVPGDEYLDTLTGDLYTLT